MFKRILLAIAPLLLTACSNFFDSDNTPTPSALTPITAEIAPHLRWSTKTGGGARDEYLKLSPTLANNTLYTSSASGIVSAIDKETGQTRWSKRTGAPITTGPGVGDGLVVVCSRRGEVIALQQNTGQAQWTANIPGEILAKPAIDNGIVIIKAVDGIVRALSTENGRILWSLQQTEPNLVLRASSAPLLQGNTAFIGFANGNLIKISTKNGRIDWVRSIATPTGAFAIQRMIDIDADPIAYAQHIFVATYQGNIAALNHHGNVLWSHDISSYTGMSADNSTVYITDAKSHIWAFGTSNGQVSWHQSQLEARNISGPANMGEYLVVGDNEGYLHWLSKRDGHIAAREFAGDAIIATPIVENKILYALTKNGSLVAYTLN